MLAKRARFSLFIWASLLFLVAGNALAVTYPYLNDADTSPPPAPDPLAPSVASHGWPRVVLTETKKIVTPYSRYSKYDVIGSQGWYLEKMAQAQAANPDGTFRSVEELTARYEGNGVTADREVIAYCRIAERSSHTWFVLKYLLGYPNVRNYDGSWTEWGNSVGVPIETGA